VLYLRLPDAHHDRWIAVAAALTGMPLEEVIEAGLEVHCTASGRTLELGGSGRPVLKAS